MKIVTKDGIEARALRVGKFFDLDGERANVEVADEAALEALKGADFSEFTVVRELRGDVRFSGYAAESFSVEYGEDRDMFSVSLAKAGE